MLINLSNHNSMLWGEEQKREASKYGYIEDILFPNIDAEADEEEIDVLVDSYFEKIQKCRESEEVTVMLQGEFVFTYRLVRKLSDAGITVVAACNKRITKEYVDEDGTVKKESIFQFIKFRKY